MTVLLFTAPGAARAASCAHADATNAEATLNQLEQAVVCLINQKRHSLDRPRVDRNGKLNHAAARHTRTMLDEDCFRHRCPGEPELGRRIRATGYLDGATKWRYAESFGCKLTPRGMVNAWLERRFHRRNLLKTRYRDIGVGAGRGAPSACSTNPALTTFTAVFAWRKP